MDAIDLQIFPLAAALFGMMILIWMTGKWMLERETRKRARMLEMVRSSIHTRRIPPVPPRPYQAPGPSQGVVAVTVKEEARPVETKRDRYEVVKV